MQPTQRQVVRVLIIEDLPTAARSIADALATSLVINYRTTVAGTLAEAVALLGTETFDLVLLDVTLPNGAGLTVMRRVREATATPVVVITGDGTEDTALTAMRSRMQDFLVKGAFDVQELLARLRRVLVRYDAEQEFYKAHCCLTKMGETVQKMRVATQTNAPSLPEIAS